MNQPIPFNQQITLPSDPTQSNEAATKNYVDTNLLNLIADDYNSSETYSEGDLVVYNNQLYRCETDNWSSNPGEDEDWSLVNIEQSVPYLNSSQVIDNKFLPDFCKWTRAYWNVYASHITKIPSFKFTCYRTGLSVAPQSSSNFGPAIIEFNGGVTLSQTDTYVASWSGDDVYNGKFLNKLGYKYIVFLLPEIDDSAVDSVNAYVDGLGTTNKWHAFVHRLSKLETTTTSTATTATLTFNSLSFTGNYVYSNPLTSLTLAWEYPSSSSSYGSVNVGLDFTTGTGFTATGFSDFTLTGLHCSNGLFTPVDGIHYVVKLTASYNKTNMVGTVAMFGLDNIAEITDSNGQINSNLIPNKFVSSDIVAPDYSSSNTYAVRDLVIYNKVLYRCKTAITTGETWDSTKWDTVTLSSAMPVMDTENHISDDNIYDRSNWTRYSSTLTTPTATLLDRSVISYHNTLTSLQVEYDDSVSESCISFSSGATATTLISGNSTVYYTGDHSIAGVFTPYAYYDYVIRFTVSNGRFIGDVTATAAMTSVTSTETTPNLTPTSGNYYQYSNPLTSLTLDLDDFSTGLIKIDFTAGNNMTISGLSDVTVTGFDCVNGVFTPVSGREYTLKLTSHGLVAGLPNITGDVALAGTVNIIPMLNVTAPTGSTVTCTHGDERLDKTVTDGQVTFYLNWLGDWNVYGAYDSEPSDSTALITAEQEQTYNIQLTFANVKVYGVRIHKNNSSPALERLGDSLNFEFSAKKAKENADGTVTITQSGYSDFDNALIYKDIKTCNLNNGVVEYYEGEEGFSWTCEHGVRLVITANETDSNEFDIAVYYNGELVTTLTTDDNGLGNNLEDVTVGSHTVFFNTSRTASLIAGTYDISGGTSSTCGSANCNSELFVTAGDEGAWSNYTSGGDVMVEIPKFYLKIEDTTDTTTIWMSNASSVGFVTSPAHCDRGDGAGERDKIYIGRYLMYNASSVSKTEPNTCQISNARLQISNKTSGFYLFGASEYYTIAYLYLIETANRNSKNCIGKGLTDIYSGVEGRLIGETDSLGYHSGFCRQWDSTSSANISEYNTMVSYRGIENLWGYDFKTIEGLVYDYPNQQLLYCTNPLNYSDYTEYDSINLQSKNGFIKTMVFDSSSCCFYPDVIGGSTSTYWATIASLDRSGVSSHLWIGGRYNSSDNASIFQISQSTVGSGGRFRVVYLP